MTAQCPLCTPGACHDDACPHGVVREVPASVFASGGYQFTLPQARSVVVMPAIASGDISNDDVRHVPFGEGKR